MDSIPPLMASQADGRQALDWSSPHCSKAAARICVEKTALSTIKVPRSTDSHLMLKTSDPMTIVATVPHQHAYGAEASIRHPLYSIGDS